MANKSYLDKTGLTYFWGKVKNLLAGKQDTLVSGSNIRTINNLSLLGDGNIPIPVITVDSSLSSSSTNPVQNKVINTALGTKQDIVGDLSTIRSGASAGATAVQPNDLATVATSGSYADLTNKPTIPASPEVITDADWTALWT